MGRVSATVEAMIREAGTLARQGRVKDAIDAYQRVLRQRPDLPNSWYNLAVEQRKAGAFDDALDSYQQALNRGIKQPEEVHLNRSVIFADFLRQPDVAERELERALSLNPRYLPALLNLGNLHEDLGRREAATAAYEKALAVEPGSFAALARYANLAPALEPNGALIQRLRLALSNRSAGSVDRAALGFALGRLLDGTGEYAAAFGAYSAANRYSRDSAPPGVGSYNRVSEERFIDRIVAAFSKVSLRAVSRNARPTPVFICGMFRSGSTLIEQVLARHARVTAGGELDLIPRAATELLAPFPESMALVPAQRLEALAMDYLQKLTHMFPGADFVTDKRPDNFIYIGLIKTLFPDAKIVHTVRNPLDNCLSIFFLHLDQRMSYALDLEDIGHHYRQYQRLMAHWKQLYGADIIDVDYDTFVHEPEPLARRLLTFLGLDWDGRCLSSAPVEGAVKTASVWQVREPIYRRASGRAKHYERQLSQLRELLAQPL
jgi:tetratricopeptide (TPR) repeat protein